MNSKAVLLEQMKSCFVKKNWFASLTESLEELTSEQASFKDSSMNHSIKEIVNHVTFWNEYYLNIFKGIPVKEAGDNDSTFSGEDPGKEISWKELLEKVEKVTKDWLDEFTKAGEDKINSNYPNSSDPWTAVISNIIIHSVYHTGQIVCLRKQHGNWNTKFGV